MRPVLFAIEATLLGAVFLFLCAGAWRIHRDLVQPRWFRDHAAMAVCLGLIGWQALTWLRADHSLSSQARVIAVWAQLLSSFGFCVATLAQANGWLVHPRASRLHSVPETTDSQSH